MNAIARILAPFATAWLFASAPVLGAEAGAVRKPSELRDAPFRDAKTVGALEKGDKVEILEKRGGWYRVKSARHAGWVRMLSVQRGAARKGGVDPRSVVALASGRAGTGRIVTTTGIRGLSEEELKLARYDEAELTKLEAYAVGRAEAEDFARQGKLAAREVP